MSIKRKHFIKNSNRFDHRRKIELSDKDTDSQYLLQSEVVSYNTTEEGKNKINKQTNKIQERTLVLYL